MPPRKEFDDLCENIIATDSYEAQTFLNLAFDLTLGYGDPSNCMYSVTYHQEENCSIRKRVIDSFIDLRIGENTGLSLVDFLEMPVSDATYLREKFLDKAKEELRKQEELKREEERLKQEATRAKKRK